MVVGVRAALREEKTYTYADLQSLLGLNGERFVAALDSLIERGRVRPALVGVDTDRVAAVGPLERDLRWRVVSRAS